MNNVIFLSYSWKDIPIAMRIYSDLIRSGVKVWRDEFSASFDESYKIQIDRALRHCKGLILLDSPNSRCSQYVKDECKALSEAGEWVGDTKRIAVCLIADVGSTRQHDELFTGHNGRKYIDFSNCNQLFDNDRSYFGGITELCKFCDTVFQPYYPDASEKDFEDELSQYHIKDIDRNILLKEFGLIGLRLKHCFPNTLSRLELFMRECEEMKVNCPSPRLQLGVEYARAGEYAKAVEILEVYSVKYPDDPRGWRALASVLFEIQEFEKALNAYTLTIDLSYIIKKESEDKVRSQIRFNNEKHLNYLAVSRINRATCLFHLKQFRKSIKEYESVFKDPELKEQLLPEYFMELIEALDQLDLKEKQIEWINHGLEMYPGDYQLNLAKARWLFEMGKIIQSLGYYEYLAERQLNDIVMYAEYLSILKSQSAKGSFQRWYPRALAIQPVSPKDIYYHGYILFLNGDVVSSKQFYKKSNYTELPWYGELWEHNHQSL